MKSAEISRMLGGGDRRSIGKSDEVVAEVLADSRLFGTLFGCIFSDDPLVRMRAADAVEKITALRPDFLRPYKVRIINRVAKSKQQEVRWHVAQLFSRLEMTTAERRKIRGILNEYLEDESRIVKTFSMQALADIAVRDERLRPSIIKQLERLMKEGSPAMQSRGRKLLAQLKKP